MGYLFVASEYKIFCNYFMKTNSNYLPYELKNYFIIYSFLNILKVTNLLWFKQRL
jgi:hypothetical protein